MHTRKRSDYLILVLPFILTVCVILGFVKHYLRAKQPHVALANNTGTYKLTELTLVLKGRLNGKHSMANTIVYSTPTSFSLTSPYHTYATQNVSFLIPAGNWITATYTTVGTMTGTIDTGQFWLDDPTGTGGMPGGFNSPSTNQVIQCESTTLAKIQGLGNTGGGILNTTWTVYTIHGSSDTYSVSSLFLMLTPGSNQFITDGDNFLFTDLPDGGGGPDGILVTIPGSFGDVDAFGETGVVNRISIVATSDTRHSPENNLVHQFCHVVYPGGYAPGCDLDALCGHIATLFTLARSRDGLNAVADTGLLRICDGSGSELGLGAACVGADVWRFGV